MDVEIINWADIPTKGNWIGKVAVLSLLALLLALHTLEGRDVNKESLADQACYIENSKSVVSLLEYKINVPQHLVVLIK